jgi:hypothetical protein
MKRLLALGLAVGLLTQPVRAQIPDGPPSPPGSDRRYQALVDNSPWFRELRVREECGEILDRNLKQRCISSFGPVPKALPVGFVPPPPVPPTPSLVATPTSTQAWTSSPRPPARNQSGLSPTGQSQTLTLPPVRVSPVSQPR